MARLRTRRQTARSSALHDGASSASLRAQPNSRSWRCRGIRLKPSFTSSLYSETSDASLTTPTRRELQAHPTAELPCPCRAHRRRCRADLAIKPSRAKDYAARVVRSGRRILHMAMPSSSQSARRAHFACQHRTAAYEALSFPHSVIRSSSRDQRTAHCCRSSNTCDRATWLNCETPPDNASSEAPSTGIHQAINSTSIKQRTRFRDLIAAGTQTPSVGVENEAIHATAWEERGRPHPTPEVALRHERVSGSTALCSRFCTNTVQLVADVGLSARRRRCQGIVIPPQVAVDEWPTRLSALPRIPARRRHPQDCAGPSFPVATPHHDIATNILPHR
jgi:hypothetical protein